MSETTDAFDDAYGVELLCEEAPSLVKAELLRAMKVHCPDIEPLDPGQDSSPFAFIHADHLIHYEAGALPAQTLVIAPDGPLDISERLAEAIDQSWTLPNVREVVARCRSSILVTDFMCAEIPYHERLALLQRALAGVLDVVSPLALHWIPSRQIITASRYREAYSEGGSSLFFAGALNVRFFNVSTSPGDMIMDTLGLGALGLPDLQCHFRNFNPNDVAAILYHTGNYLFGHGDIIEDGHTLAGIPEDSRWQCQRVDSLAPPARVVIDLDPGPPHAAGDRSPSCGVL